MSDEHPEHLALYRLLVADPQVRAELRALRFREKIESKTRSPLTSEQQAAFNAWRRL